MRVCTCKESRAKRDRTSRYSRPPIPWDPLSLRNDSSIREMGGAPRNPAPRKHFLVWIFKPSGCHCTDALGGKTYRRVPTPPRSCSLLSDSSRGRAQANRCSPPGRGPPPASRRARQFPPHASEGGRVVLTEMLLPRMARQGSACLISRRG